MPDATGTVNVGTLGKPEDSIDGVVTLICEPDMTDLWAHMWSHDA
jgi:hypothetical protein